MCDDYGTLADFRLVYIAEAHSDDGWQTRSNLEEGVVIRQHTSLGERRAAARRCAIDLELEIETVVDDMSDAACKAFAAWPERIYILGPDGRIAYLGGHGPYDFRPDQARAALEQLLQPAESALEADPEP